MKENIPMVAKRTKLYTRESADMSARRWRFCCYNNLRVCEGAPAVMAFHGDY